MNNSKYEEGIMERSSRPPRLFKDNIMTPYDIIPAIGEDIIRRYKINHINHENILYFEEISFQKSKLVTILVITDLRVIYAMVNINNLVFLIKYLKNKLKI